MDSLEFVPFDTLDWLEISLELELGTGLGVCLLVFGLQLGPFATDAVLALVLGLLVTVLGAGDTLQLPIPFVVMLSLEVEFESTVLVLASLMLPAELLEAVSLFSDNEATSLVRIASV